VDALAQALAPPDGLWTWVTTGNAPNYVAVVVASVAAIFAFRSSQASRRSADAAQQQLKRVLDDKERELAEALHILVTKDEPFSRKSPLSALFFDVVNDSRQWVFDILLYRQHEDKMLKICAIDAVPPGSSPDFYVHYVSTSGDENVEQVEMRGVGYLLRDAHGKYWHRSPVGTLSKITDREYRELRSAASSLADDFFEANADYISSSLKPGGLWKVFRVGR